MGVAKFLSGRVDEAILDFANVDDELKGMGRDFNELKGLNSNLLGNSRYALGEYDLAESRWREALEVFLELGDDLNAAVARSNLSNVYWETGRQEESIRLGTQALETANSINHFRTHTRSSCWTNLPTRKMQWENGRPQ